MMTEPDPRVPRRIYEKKVGEKRHKYPSDQYQKKRGPHEIRCAFCGAKFSDVQSRSDHVFFCRMKHEREQGVQE
jgi:5-methylcytosine-specific restriction endonuclease McrA